MVSQELLTYLMVAAANLSGYPAIPVEDLPKVLTMPPKDIAKNVCPADPQNCDNIVATFETDQYVIFVRDSLDLETSADNSFLLHEIVHVLQFKKNGEAIYKDCPTTMKTETEAYKAQNAYLKREGQFLRFGEALSFMSCAETQNTFFTRDVMLEPVINK